MPPGAVSITSAAAGDCLQCTRFNMQALAQALLVNVLLSLFLLHKATKPVVSADELQLVRRRRSAWPHPLA